MVGPKIGFKYEGYRSNLILIHFVYNWKIGRSSKNTEIVRENAFEQKKKILGFKFNRGLALKSRPVIQDTLTVVCPGLNADAKLASKLFLQFWEKQFEANCYQKCIEETTNIVKITNSTRIASSSKNLLANNSLSQF